jgi:hypothetical protein
MARMKFGRDTVVCVVSAMELECKLLEGVSEWSKQTRTCYAANATP